jgi:hypothetical protein
MRHACISTCAFLLLACGGEPIHIQSLDFASECYFPLEAGETPTTTEHPDYYVYTAVRQMLEFRVSYAIALAQLLTKPIAEHPEAGSWSEHTERGSIEGEVLADGDGWSTIRMVARDEEGTYFQSAEIHTTLNRTTYDFGGWHFDVREQMFSIDDYVRGCTERGVSFEVGPVVTDEGIESVPHCWPQPEPSDPSDPEQAKEIEESFRLQCLQAIESVRVF